MLAIASMSRDSANGAGSYRALYRKRVPCGWNRSVVAARRPLQDVPRLMVAQPGRHLHCKRGQLDAVGHVREMVFTECSPQSGWRNTSSP
jgi:hypothetical protein